MDDLAARSRRLLSESPSLLLLMLATAVMVWLAADEGGYRGTTFLPATILLLALLVIGIVALPFPRPTRAQWLAIGLLAGYAAWTYLSITWADQKDLAWESANRTTMYAIVLALFTLWRSGGRGCAAVGIVYALGIGGLGLIELIKASGTSNPIEYFDEARLAEPVGYTNANVALWTSAAWLAAIYAGRREVPVLLRGALLGTSGLLTALAILGQSRAWVPVVAVVLLLTVAIVPERGRTLGALALVAIAIAAISTPLLDVYRDFENSPLDLGAVSRAMQATLIASGLLVLAGIVWGLADRATVVSEERRRQLGTGLVVAFLALCVAGLVGFTAVRGNPVTKTADAWSEFQEGGYEPHFEGSRLGSLGGTYRYDYWVVAWHEFTDHPLTGVGGDNFSRDYLIHGVSKQTPSYPHSVEVRALSETGLIGALLLAGAIGAALFAAVRRIRRAPGLAAVGAAAGVVVFAYFVAHGSFDWLWEFPALGAPAFALLGLGMAVEGPAAAALTSRPARVAAAAAVAALSLLVLVATVPPWLAERELDSAKHLAATDPAAALDKLERSADLNPLSAIPLQTAAVIETQQGNFAAARQYYAEALDRDAGDPFVYLSLAVIASASGERQKAERLIRHAHQLNPRDGVTNQVKRSIDAGHRVRPEEAEELIRSDLKRRVQRK